MDAIIKATQNLETTIHNKLTSPYSQLVEAQQDALQQLAKIFSTFTTPLALHPQPRVSNTWNIGNNQTKPDATQMMQTEPRMVTQPPQRRYNRITNVNPVVTHRDQANETSTNTNKKPFIWETSYKRFSIIHNKNKGAAMLS